MKTILIIEDEPGMRRNIATMLKLEGYNVIEAENGRTGVEQALAHTPDMILCDITMPDMDGFTAIARIRETPALHAVPFIFLTAKPFTAADLLAAIEARMIRVQNLRSASEPSFDSAEPLEKLGLTPSEAAVLLWMAQGKSNAAIAAIVDASVATVKKHAQHIFDKLGVDNRASASLTARETLLNGG